MVQKRPYEDEDVFRISYKHPRQQVEHTKELVSFSESVLVEEDGSALLPHYLEEGITNVGTEGDEKLSCDVSTDLPGDDEEYTKRCFSTSSWPTSSTKPPFDFTFFPQCFSPVRTSSHCEDIYNLLMNHTPPRKAVPIGPDHQAYIPPLGVSKSKEDNDDDEQQRLMGKCVISMPSLDFDANSDSRVGIGRTDCDCEEKGSFGCVRKHGKESRDELLRTIGPEAFAELGFCQMGEEVALHWTDEEEREFHRVVFSNPASSGTNFWDKLSAAFPHLSKSEIVSYYFNVFMLRKRAAQNRFDPENVDSDNDEWQGNDDCDDDEDDDDSVIESPNIADKEEAHVHSNQNINDYRPSSGQEVDDELIGGDSCLSFDTSLDSLRDPVASENINCHQNGDFSGFRNQMMESETGSHCPSSGGFGGYILETCYTKDWEAGSRYVTCSKNEVDFLPTSNVIEEVFGDETRN